MKKFQPKLGWVGLMLSLILVSCSSESLDLQNELSVQELSSESSLDAKKASLKFNASLKGSNEVPSNDSKATGQAIVTIADDGSWIHYKITIANIENVTMAHFHLAPAGTNGSPVVWLYDNRVGQPAGPSNGILAEGTITQANLVGPLAGQSLGSLIWNIREGNIYVNVHSTSFPGGEVRGQL